jgi:hypothetical protein
MRCGDPGYTRSAEINRVCDLILFASHEPGPFVETIQSLRASPWWWTRPTNEYTNLKSAVASGEIECK